jgi:predicted acyltransferase
MSTLAPPARFQALDVFRGMTICLMIVVNTPGTWESVFGPLLHADWHGFTPTDLVFPSFLFAVGNAMAFSTRKWAEKSFGSIFGKVLKRFLLLFLLGYSMYWLPFFRWTEAGSLEVIPFADTRVLGVLQRIALCYLAAALLIFSFKPRQLWLWSAGLLLGYWALLSGLGDLTLEGNAVRSLDRWLFGDSHLWAGDGLPFDPEGLLSTLPAIVNVLAGYLLGRYLREGGINYEKLARILLIGALLLFVAYLWDLSFPYNKKLWTSSFVVLTTGLDLLLIGGILFLTDLRQPPLRFRFFEIFGLNPLAIYLLSEYLAIFLHVIRVDAQTSLYHWLYLHFFSWIGPKPGSLAFALSFMLLNWLAAWWLWKRNIMIKV